MSTYTATAEFVRRVRRFAQTQPEWAEAVRYDTKPDERFNLTLVSRRVYGISDEVLTIMAAAGLGSIEQELREQRLVLPTSQQLLALKSLSGFVNLRFDRTAQQAADPLRTR